MTYKRASFTLMTVLTGLLCFCAILLSTPWGAQLTFSLVGGASSLQVEYRSGTLLNDLQLSQLTINNEKIVIKVKEVSLQFNLLCLWKNQVCIDELSIASLRVNMKENSSASSDELIEDIIIPAFFTLPFSVKMKKLSLTKAQIKNQNVELNLTGFSSTLLINKRAINIENAMLASAYINLSAARASSFQSVQAVQAVQPVQSTVTSISPWPLAKLPKVYLPFHLKVKSFAVNKLIVTETTSISDDKTLLHIEDAVARLSWFETKLTIEKLSSMIETVDDFSYMGDFSLMGNIDLVHPYVVDVTLSNSIKNSKILPQLNDSKQHALLNGDLSRLSVKVDSQGALALTAEALIDITNANLPYKLAANITKFTLPSDMTNIINPSMFLLQSQGDLTQQTMDLKSEFTGLGYQNVKLELDANLHNKKLKINTLHLRDTNAANMLNMSGELNFGDSLSWDVNVDSSGITLPDIDQRVSGRVQGKVQSKGFWHDKNDNNMNEWAFSLIDSTVQGEINNIKLNAQANVDVNHKGQLAPSEIVLNYGDIALKLNGYSDEEWHVDGTANIGNTNSWLKEIESSLSAKIGLSGPIYNPDISLQGEFKKLLMANLSSDAIGFEAKYRPMNNHAHQVTFTSLLMNWNEYKINNVNITSRGDLEQQRINLAWLGDSSIDLLIDSHYSPLNGQLELQTENTAFSLGEHVFKSNQPIHLLYKKAQNTLAINEHCWLGSLSQLCLSDNTVVNLNKGEVTLALNLDIELLKSFMPKYFVLDSTVDGSISIGWQPEYMPSVDAKLFISAGQVQVNKESNLVKLLQWQKGQLNLKMHNNSVEGNIALLSYIDGMEVLNAGTAISFADNRIVDSHITINNFNLSPLHVFLPALSSLEGRLNTKLTIDGDLDNPRINGGITLTGGKTEILGNINTLEDINMALDFKGSQAVLTGGININKVGANLTGKVDWHDELRGDVNFDGESLNFSVPPDLTLTVSPHLNAQIKASEIKLSGRIEVIEGKLSVNKLPQGSVSLSKDAIIVNDQGEQVVNEKPFDVLTNIRIVIADAFHIEGQGFVGRLGGELQVSQQSRQPLQLFGSLNIPEGHYRAYGQNLSITKGDISFNGPVNNPYVSMQATRSIEKEDVIVGIDATGLANSLSIKLFSKPTMQQSETLSYLVRGRGLDAKTNNSNAAIGVALGTAITNYSGVLTQIEKLPLINKLEIDGDDEQASIAGYLGDKVYIKYGIGITEPIEELTVRFYFYSRLWVEAVSGLENSANIYYSFDIE